jgi:quinol monooxygenase YgiN
MTIESVNTIEIRLIEPQGIDFEDNLKRCIDRLQLFTGCLGYVLNRSEKENTLWLLSGYWESVEEMTHSFDSVAMAQLINFLIEADSSLKFATFRPHVSASHGH